MGLGTLPHLDYGIDNSPCGCWLLPSHEVAMEEPYILNKNIAGTMTVDDEDMATYFARLKRLKEGTIDWYRYLAYLYNHPDEEDTFYPFHPNSIIKVEFW